MEEVILMRKVSFPNIVPSKNWNAASFTISNVDDADHGACKEFNKMRARCQKRKTVEHKTRGTLIKYFAQQAATGKAGTATYNAMLQYLFDTAHTKLFESIFSEMTVKAIPRTTETLRLLLQKASTEGNLKRSELIFQRIFTTDVLTRVDVLSVIRAFANYLKRNEGNPNISLSERTELRLRASKYLNNRLLEPSVACNYYIRMFNSLEEAEEFVRTGFTKYDLTPDESTYYFLLCFCEAERKVVDAKRLLSEAKRLKRSSVRLESMVLSTISLAIDFPECLRFVSSISNVRQLTEKEFTYLLRCCKTASTGTSSSPYITAKLSFKRMQLEGKETSRSLSHLVDLFIRYRSTSDLTSLIEASFSSNPWLWKPLMSKVSSFYKQMQMEVPSVITNVQPDTNMPVPSAIYSGK
eukprot:TRINITY_DN20938_c0_g1_i2.p1 TRINITY_DN20938_c0_g1~~TRINITY_DN20938_c0_g1_i2.p1  ORF type:complete len:411 (+),score=60.88 TRINITY_DN20938_c0_g1_i2:824-2056(+)